MFITVVPLSVHMATKIVLSLRFCPFYFHIEIDSSFIFYFFKFRNLQLEKLGGHLSKIGWQLLWIAVAV